jgi:copper(I)-binding protein
VNRFDIRHSRTAAMLAAGGLLGAAVLTGCSSGQIAQTAKEQSAVNGATLTINNMALRNVHIQALQMGDFLQPGHKVDLVMAVINQSPDVDDKLVGITTDVGTVTLTGSSRVPAGGVLFVGSGEGQNRKAADAVATAENAKATVALDKPITNGLTYNFTFDFEKAGRGSVQVPISAPTKQP